MQGVTDNFKAAVNAPTRNIDVVVKFAGKDEDSFTNARVYSSKDLLLSLKIIDGQTTGGFGLGGTICPSLTAELHKTAVVTIGDKARAELIVYNGGGNLTIASEFTVDNIKRKADGSLSVTALGNMIKLAKNYVSELTYPATQLQVLEEIAAQSGYELHPTISNELINNPEIQSAPIKGTAADGTTLYYTRREMLGYAAAINGGAAHISQYGYIGLARHNDTGETFTHEQVFQETITEPYTIASVRWNSTGISYSLGDDYDENTVEFYNPLMYNARELIAHNLETDLIGLGYDGAIIKKQGCGYFEVGDIVHYVDISGTTHDLLILGIVYEFANSYFTETLYSLANTATQREYAGNENITTERKPDEGGTGGIAYITQKVQNIEDSSINSLQTTVLNLDFEVKGKESDVIFVANQCVSITKEGLVEYSYLVDGIDNGFAPLATIKGGRHIIPHIIPMELLIGKHNLTIQQKSSEAIGTTLQGELQGAISGQIGEINITIQPRLYTLIRVGDLDFRDDETGELFDRELHLYAVAADKESSIEGNIDWGDGTIEPYTNVDMYHTYSAELAESRNFAPYDVKIYNPYTAVKMFAGASGAYPYEIHCVKLADSVTRLENNAFKGVGIGSIEFSPFLEHIGNTAFSEGGVGSSITIPSTVKYIGPSAFYKCNVETVKAICPGITTLGASAFASSMLKNIEMEVNVPLSSGLFNGCSHLENVTIRGNVTALGGRCFYNAITLKLGGIRIELPEEKITSVGEYCFYGCNALTSHIPINANTTIVGDYAYANSGVTSADVTIHDNLDIGLGVFNNCSDLSSASINVMTTGEMLNVPANMFTGCTALSSLSISELPISGEPSGGVNIGNAICSGCTALKSVNISTSGECKIGTGAFSRCANLTSVTGSNIVFVGSDAFNGCSQLESFNFSSCKTIGERAFTSVTWSSVTLPSDCTYHGNSFPTACTVIGGILK